MADCKKKFATAFAVFMLVFGASYALYNFIIAVKGYILVDKHAKNINELSDDWNTLAFSSFEVVTAASSCSADYTEAFTEIWGGTFAGCDCTGVTSTNIESTHRNTYFEGGCSANETAAGCNPISAVSSIDMKKFDGSRVCGKRSTVSWASVTRPFNDSNNPCPSGYKKCGSQTDLTIMTCILASEACPVVAIQVGSSSPGSTWTQATGTISGSGNKVYYSTEQTGKIPTGNLYMNYASPCVIPSEHGGYSRDFYFLEKTQYFTGCSSSIAGTKVDTRYTELTSVAETTLYSDNGVITALTGKAGYSSLVHVGNDHKVWYRNYIAWDINCEWESKKDRRQVLEDVDDVKTAVSRLLSLMILTICHILIVKVVFGGVKLFFKCNKKERDYQLTNIIGKSVNTLFNILLITFIVVLRLAIEKTKSAIRFSKDTKCSDDIMDESLNFLGSELEDSYRETLAGLILTILYLLMEIVTLIIAIRKYRMGEENHDKVATFEAEQP